MLKIKYIQVHTNYQNPFFKQKEHRKDGKENEKCAV